METCADCGKPILQLGWTQHDPWGKGGPSKHFHSGCGDPFGIKAKDAEIERLRAALKNIAIGSGDRVLTMEGMRAVAFDALEQKIEKQ